jgi:adenosylcobinamide amidohydrolase
VPTTISITALGDLPVPFVAGQDLNGNSFAGEAGEPRVTGCAAPGAAVSLATSVVPWVDGMPVSVFVYAGSTNTACRGASSHGTVTINTTL